MPHQETSSTFSLADALWRRRWLAAGVVLWTLTVAIGAAVSLPDLYRAAATVIVQRESESRSLSPIEVTADLEARIQTITQETLSRTHLETLIGRFNIYPEIQRRDGLEAAVNRLRSDVKLQFKDSSADTNVPGTAAFTVSVVHADPFVAALVANNLAASYLEQNQHIRNGQAHDTAELLKAQLDEAKRRLDSQNQQASSLRQRYAGELPEQATANLAALERLSTELRLNGDRQQRATERREQLIDPVAAPRPGAGATEPASTGRRLGDLKDELVQLRARFTEQYPEVRRVEQEIARLENQAVAPAPVRPSGSPEGASANQPRARALDTVDRELQTLAKEAGTLRSQMAAYERRLENTPQRDQEIKDRSRDSGSTAELYYSLLKRYEDARLAESVERHQTGEQFRVLDSALPPALPAAPNRVQILLLGVVLAFGVAGAAVMIAERLDTSFHSLDDLRAFTRLPVLATIPPIVTSGDRGRRRWRRGLVAVCALAALTLTAVAVRRLGAGNTQIVRLLARGRI